MAITVPVGALRKAILNNEILTLSAEGGGSGGIALSAAGNTAGALALISSGTAILAGGNNITLSQAGQNITISAANIPGQSVQTQNMVDLTLAGNTSGALALMSSGTVTIVGGNNITLSQAGNAVTISAASQSVQPEGTQTVGISNLGNTSGTSGVATGTGIQFILAGGNNITLSQSINGSSATVTISAFNQSVQTQSLGSDTLGISNLGNTSGTSGVVSGSNVQLILAGGNNITLSQSVNGSSATVTISAFNQSVQTQSLGSDTLGISNLGNTSGTSGVVSGSNVQLILAGGNNITLSQSINGSSATVTISAFNQSVQTQNCVDVTLAGNTSGALALISSGTMTLAGGNNITLSQAGNAVTISAAATAAGLSAGMSTQGNTAGTTGLVQSQLVLVGTNNVSLSQSVNGQSATVSIDAAPVLSYFHNIGRSVTDSVGTSASIIHFFPIHPVYYEFPGNMTVKTNRLRLSCNMSVTNASSQAHTYTVQFAIYTVNGSTLSLHNSVSTTFGSANTNRSFSTMYHGIRFLTFNSSQWSNTNVSFVQGSMYFGAVQIKSSSTNHAFSWIVLGMGQGLAVSGTIGTSAAGSFRPLWGLGQTTTTGNMPTSIALTAINNSAGMISPDAVFDVEFDNVMSAF